MAAGLGPSRLEEVRGPGGVVRREIVTAQASNSLSEREIEAEPAHGPCSQAVG